MNFDAQEFFISLLNLYSFALPTAIITSLLMCERARSCWVRCDALGGAQARAAFLFASYFFGHLIFLFGSWLDEFYDWV